MTPRASLTTFLMVCTLLAPFPLATSKRQLLQVASKTSPLAPSLSQSTGSSGCKLPMNAQWADVQLDDVPSFKMAVRTGDDVLSWHIKDKGQWGELSNVSTYGPPGTALDIGGNIGYYTFALASAGWKVYTFEPMAENLALIKATLCENPRIRANVHLFEMGLSSENKVCTMMVNPANRGNGQVMCSGAGNWEGESLTMGSFPLRRLEEILSQESVSSIDFVKLDVEGYECDALKGAPSFFSKYHPRLMKTEVWYNVVGCTVSEYLDMFRTNGYKVAKWEDVYCSSPLENPEEEESLKSSGVADFYMCA